MCVKNVIYDKIMSVHHFFMMCCYTNKTHHHIYDAFNFNLKFNNNNSRKHTIKNFW